tara:strand:+ start:274 stop:465 length:192 start_codon:yes stop_codon:yes gene_type:complete
MSIITKVLHSKTAPGILLCLAALFAVVFANTSLNSHYELFKSIPVVFQAGTFIIDKPFIALDQ